MYSLYDAGCLRLFGCIHQHVVILLRDVVAANCGAQQELMATSSDQYITSPGYLTRYPLQTSCTWRISVRIAHLPV